MIGNKLKNFPVSILLVLVFFLCIPLSGAACSGLAADSRLETPDYWIAKLPAPNTTVMTEKQIQDYNRAVRQAMPDTVVDLRNYPQILDGKRLAKLVTAASFPSEVMYRDGMPVQADFYNSLRAQLNLQAIKAVSPVQYGFTVMRTNLRTFPTDKGVFSSIDDQEFDIFQETAVDPAVPAVILHQSLDKAWLFVQISNYRGWMPARSVAVAASRREWKDSMNRARFLVVAGNRLDIYEGDKNAEPIVFEMGAKLPLVQSDDKNKNRGYRVLLPARDLYGKLYFKQVEAAGDADVHLGYLPYTAANVINQAFKFYGQPYGWGGMHNSVDCSSLVMDIYRSFGIILPRNADQQEVNVGKIYRFDNSDTALITKKLLLLQPGATLHMDGHVMLYLGKEDNQFYVIHALGSYGDANRPDADGTLARIAVMRVVVSDLNLSRRNGKTLLESLTTAKEIVR